MHGERACVAAGIRIPEPRPVTRLPLFQPRGTRCQSGPSGPWQQRACAAHHVLTASPARGYHSPGHWWPASLQRPGHDCCTKGTLPFLDVAIIIRKWVLPSWLHHIWNLSWMLLLVWAHGAHDSCHTWITSIMWFLICSIMTNGFRHKLAITYFEVNSRFGVVIGSQIFNLGKLFLTQL